MDPEEGFSSESVKYHCIADRNSQSMRKEGGVEMSISIHALSKSCNGMPVFQNVDLELEEGGIYCLLAPSGAGKTTLFRILMGLEQADEGQIKGIPRGPVAAVFQEDRLCPALTAQKNIRLVHPVIPEEDLRRELQVLLPEDCLDKPVCEFSGGMRRRVALMRAMLAPGQLLLMDEPFTGLDEDTREAAMEYVLRHRRGRTLLFTTHHVEEAQRLEAVCIQWQEKERNWKVDK